MKWKNIKIGGKILAGFGLIMALILIGRIFEIRNFRHIEKQSQILEEEVIPGTFLITDAKLDWQEARYYLLRYIFTSNKTDLEKGKVYINKVDDDIQKTYELARTSDNRKEIESILDQLQQLIISYKGDLTDLTNIVERYTEQQEIQNLEGAKETLKRRDNQITKMAAKSEEILSIANKLVTFGKEITYAHAEETISILERTNSSNRLRSIIVIVIGLTTAFFISRMLSSTINKSVQMAESIAAGNLNVEIDERFINRNDEIGTLANALQRMNEKLKGIVFQVIQSADMLVTASNEITYASQQISNGASEQASSVEEVSSSMEEIDANIQQNTQNASATDRIATQASQRIEALHKGSEQLKKSTENISNKIDMIRDIASQTNILALNAAIEAARAGEHGKGFAVVAAEVRKLAEQSRQAAHEIEQLSTSNVKITGTTMNELNSVIPEILKTNELVKEIHLANEEQASGTGHVNSAIQQLNQITQENAAASEELASNSEQLNMQAEDLKKLVNYFKID